MDGKTIGIIIFTVIILIVVILVLTLSGYSKDTTNITNNNKIKSLLYADIMYNEDMTIMQDPSCAIIEADATNNSEAEKKGLYKIRDYYIFSSYNSCNESSETQYNIISLKALRYVISQGVRFLDFEIYSLKDVPIVSTSTNPDNYNQFESNNYVNFSDAFEVIINNCFNISTCPNDNDPIFIHLRIKSNNDKMFENLATIFDKYQESTNYMLGTEYSYERLRCTSNKSQDSDSDCTSTNITDEPLYYFKQKIIIILDRNNIYALDNKTLMEFINLTSHSLYCRLINNFTMVNSQDQLEILEFNKRTVTIVTPDFGINKNNPNINNSKLLGIQFNANNFHKKDKHLTNAINMFNTFGCAFILKPSLMRYFPLTVEIPPRNPDSMSFKERDIKSRFVNFSI
jgi:hypothetical protein